MRVRDLVTSGVFLIAFAVHFGLQWYGWKAHIEEITVVNGDSLWSSYSYPLFVWIPRRVQNLHFYELLIANSLLWASAIAWCTYIGARLLSRARRTQTRRVRTPKPTPAEVTRTDRLVELKRMMDQGLISKEEYQNKRETILIRL